MTDSSSHGTALDLFEQFLISYHESGSGAAGFEAFCRQHQEHEEVFRRWWDQLLQTGEVSGVAVDVGPEPVEGERFGRYRLVRELGRGSQGCVFLAEDSELGRQVALKVLPTHRAPGEDHRRRFAREAELASRLDHPGLCAIYDRGMSGSSSYLAMRFVDGETLAAAISRARRQAEVTGKSQAIRLGENMATERDAIAAVLRVFEQVADALHAAHEKGLIHRDVKPGNIIIDRQGQPVLLDFGLARDVESAVALTLSGDLVGTPAYMSPEQLAAHRIDLDRRTDVYSLGATLYECLTIRRPFEAVTRNELYQQILTAEPTSPRRLNPGIPKDLEIVVQTALEKDRNRRYRTAADLADDLRRVREVQAIRARKAGVVRRMQRWVQRNPVVASSVVLVFLVMAVGLAVSLWFHAQSRRAQAGFDRLADQTRLAAAQDAARPLKQAHPDQVEALEAWLRVHGEPLRGRLPEHEEYLLELRKRAVPYTPEDRERDRRAHPASKTLAELRTSVPTLELGATSASQPEYRGMWGLGAKEARSRIAAIEKRIAEERSWRFVRQDEQLAHDSMAELVRRLREFTAPDGLLARMQDNLEWSRALRRRAESDRSAWQRVAADIQASDRYGNRRLKPQVGLLPIGRDPESGLEEFAHLRSGEVPVRDPASGKLSHGKTSAMVFVLLPGGKFRMGNDLSARQPVAERFEVDVELDWFFLSKFEMTRGQWRRLAGPGAADPPGSLVLRAGEQNGDEYPVESVSWEQAKTLLGEHFLDLPTEAQWEFGTRGGVEGKVFWWGDDRPGRRQVGNIRDRSFRRIAPFRVAAFGYDDGFALTAPVGSFEPNGFGLHDVCGNVSEWCRDAFFGGAPLHLFEFRKGDGLHTVPPTKSKRAVRGGSFDTPAVQTYVAFREGRYQGRQHSSVGVRAVRKVE